MIMIYGFYLTRFHYGPFSATRGCSAVIDDERKTLRISHPNEATIFSAQELSLKAISSVSSGREPGTLIISINTPAPNSASGGSAKMFIAIRPAPEREFFYRVLTRWGGKEYLQVEEYAFHARSYISIDDC